MMFGAIFLLGVISLGRLKVSLFPDIVFPRLTILTGYPNVAPDEIENLVTRPIEDAVSSVSGVKKIRSFSREGLSIVDVTFEWDTNLDLATIQVRQKVDLARNLLPQQAEKSIIDKFDPSSDPVITIVARPVGLSFENTRDYIEKNVRPFFERINGVANISIRGGRKREVQVNVDSKKMHSRGLSIDGIAQALGSSNFNFPAGNVRKGDRELTVRIMGEFLEVDEIQNVVIGANEAGVPIYLHEIAELHDDYKEKKGGALHNGTRAIVLGLKKEPGKNTVETAKAVRAELGEINKRFERDVQFEIIQDRSEYIAGAINSVRNSALMGGMIAFMVLFSFLKDLRASLIIVVTIPIAILSTFVLMFVMGISLNIMSLGGLALGVGMLVDNSIVVLESVFLEQEENPQKSFASAAADGARKVAGSVFASTLTSIVVFFPIIFVPGIAGKVFKDLALTVSFSLMSSLVCSLTLIPMLASLKLDPNGWLGRLIVGANKAGQPLFAATEALILTIRKNYSGAMNYALVRPGRILGFSFGLTILGALLLLPIDRQLFPEVDQGVVTAVMELPGGTSVEDSEDLHARIQKYLMDRKLSFHAITNVGHDEADRESLIKGNRKGNYSESIYYVDRSLLSSEEFITHMEAALSGLGNLKSNFRVKGDALQELLGEAGASVLVEIESSDRDVSRPIARAMGTVLEKAKGIKSIESSAVAQDPEIKIYLDRQKIAATGLSAQAVANAVRASVLGVVPTTYRKGDQEIDVRVRLRQFDRKRIDQLDRVFLAAGQNGMLELSHFITHEEGKGFPAILRENQRRIEQIKVRFDPDYEEEVYELLNKLKAKADEEHAHLTDTRPAISVKQENQETLDSLQSLVFAFLLSSVMIYMLLGGQFESFLHPFTLALSIPMMLFGVSFSLLITGHTLNVTSATGMIMLVGIVVNAAIVLYEFIQQNRDPELAADGKDLPQLPDILIKSGQDRIRPILLTTLTTLLGLVPMAIGMGQGGDLQAPMAVVVIGGLLVSSVLTLIAFPTLYMIAEYFRVQGLAGAWRKLRE